MSPMRRVLAFLFLTGLFALAPTGWAQKPATPVTERELQRRSFAVNFLRALNTAELDYKLHHGTYANWDVLLANNYFTDAGTKWGSEDFPTVTHAMYSRGPEIVPGWKLRLNTSNGGKSYDALLEDATDPKCSYAGQTDERGLIRQSKAIDCPI